LAEKLNLPGFKYKDAAAVLREISKNVPGFPAKPDRKPRRLTAKARLEIQRRRARRAGRGSHVLVAEPGGFGYCGTDLSSKVEGLQELALEEGFRLHPEDLRALKVEAGEPISISVNGFTVTGVAKADAECPQGAVYFYRPIAYGGLEHRAGLDPLYRLKANPVEVRVGPVKSSAGSAGKVRAVSG
jgi:hypothetical protein